MSEHPLRIPEPTLIKCEKCGTEVETTFKSKFTVKWPAGWVQSGLSKYGRQYHRAGRAWYCPCFTSPTPPQPEKEDVK